MGFRCPWGHQSTNEEYCDFCGALNPAAASGMVRTPGGRSGSGITLVQQLCQVCGTRRDGRDRYCANCGYDFEAGEPLPDDDGDWRVLPTGPPNGAPEPSLGVTRPDFAGPADPGDAEGGVPTLVLLVRVITQRLEEPNSPPRPSDLTERVFMVDRSPIVIGRDGPGLDIPIHGDPYVSRRHAEIVWMGSGWGVRDLGSTNGTRVNGVVVEGSEVRTVAAADVIDVGYFTQITVRDI